MDPSESGLLPNKLRHTVVLVDLHPLFRLGVAHALNSSKNFRVVGEAETVNEAEILVSTMCPGLLFIDVDLPQGFSMIERSKALSPVTRTIVLSGPNSKADVRSAFDAGASGYLLKSVGVIEIRKAAEAIVDGGIYVSQQLVGLLLTNTRVHGLAGPAIEQPVHFSGREEEILAFLTKGMCNKEIATNIGISEKTVKHYLTTMMKKLQVSNRVGVALFAVRRSSRN